MLERISHFAAAVITDPTNTRVWCIGLLCAFALAAWRYQSIHLHRTVFGRLMFTSDVRIPEFLIHI